MTMQKVNLNSADIGQIVKGSKFDDLLSGSSQSDVLIGNNGDDKLIGNQGKDYLTGGLGKDTFVFKNGDSSVNNPDLILDFSTNQKDQIDLSNYQFLNTPTEVFLSPIDKNKEGIYFDAVNKTLTLQSKINGEMQTDIIQFKQLNLSSEWIFDSSTKILSLKNKVQSIKLSADNTDLTLDFSLSNENQNLTGSKQNDVLKSGSGNDKLIGLDGNDILNAGTGNDILTGGKGNDTFIINPNELKDNKTSYDIKITDFSSEDILDLSNFKNLDLSKLKILSNQSDSPISYDSTTSTLSIQDNNKTYKIKLDSFKENLGVLDATKKTIGFIEAQGKITTKFVDDKGQDLKTLDEGKPAFLKIEVDKARLKDVKLSVESKDGKALDKIDYESLKQDVVIEKGKTSVLVPIKTIENNDFSYDLRDFEITVKSDQQNLETDTKPLILKAEITENDQPMKVSVQFVDSAKKEINSGLESDKSTNILIKLEKPLSKEVKLNIFTVSQIAKDGVDFTGIKQEITIPAKQTEFLIPLNIIDNSSYDFGSAKTLEIRAMSTKQGLSTDTDLLVKTFSILDDESDPPAILIKMTPTDKTIDILPQDKISFEFNEIIYQNQGKITLKNLTTNQIYEEYDVASSLQVVADKNKPIVTIDPKDFLPNGDEYQLSFESSAFRDSGGNLLTRPTTLNFSVIDTTPPELLETSKINYLQTENAVILDFDSEIQNGTGAIEIYQNNKLVDTITHYNVSDKKLEFAFNLDPKDREGDFILKLPKGLVKDKATTPNDNLATEYQINVKDDIIPVLQNLTPLDKVNNQTIDVKSNENIVLTFDEPMFKNAGLIVIKNLTTNTDYQTIDVSDANLVQIHNSYFDAQILTERKSIITINPTDFVQNGDLYGVTFDNQLFKDKGDNFADPEKLIPSIAFNVLDTTPPKVTANSLKAYVQTDEKIKITFDSEILKVDGKSIEIYQNNTKVDTITNYTQLDKNTIEFSFKTLIQHDREGDYVVKLPVGIVQDKATTPNDNPVFDYSINVKDDIAPEVTKYNYQDNDTVGKSKTFTLTFDDPIQKGIGEIKIIDVTDDQNPVDNQIVTLNDISINQNVFSFKPDYSKMTEAHLYKATIPATLLKDASPVLADNNNQLSKEIYINFKADITDPTLTGSDPKQNQIDVKSASDITLTFSEPIQKTKGTFTLTNLSDNTKLEDIDLLSNQIKINENVLIINPNNDFDPNGYEYSLTLTEYVITDLSGNSYIYGSPIIFKVIDTTAPKLDANNKTSYNQTDKTISLTFNELIQNGTGSIEIKQNSAVKDTIANYNISSKTLSFDLNSTLLAGTYTIDLPAGLVKDKATNPNENAIISIPFTMVDNINPKFVSGTLTSIKQSEIANASIPIILTFDEDIAESNDANLSLSIKQNGSEVQKILSTDSSVNLVSNETTKLQFNLDKNNLLAEGSYSIDLPAGFVTDKSTNPVEAKTDILKFDVIDDLAPIYSVEKSRLNPQVKQNEIDSAYIDIVFNESVKIAENTTFSLNNNLITPEIVSIPNELLTNNIVRFKISDPTTYSAETHNLTILKGSITDLKGNPTENDIKTSITFIDDVRPKLTNTTVQTIYAQGDSTHPHKLVFTFDEPIKLNATTLLGDFYFLYYDYINSTGGSFNTILKKYTDITVDNNKLYVDIDSTKLIDGKYFAPRITDYVTDLAGNKAYGYFDDSSSADLKNGSTFLVINDTYNPKGPSFLKSNGTPNISAYIAGSNLIVEIIFNESIALNTFPVLKFAENSNPNTKTILKNAFISGDTDGNKATFVIDASKIPAIQANKAFTLLMEEQISIGYSDEENFYHFDPSLRKAISWGENSAVEFNKTAYLGAKNLSSAFSYNATDIQAYENTVVQKYSSVNFPNEDLYESGNNITIGIGFGGIVDIAYNDYYTSGFPF